METDRPVCMHSFDGTLLRVGSVTYYNCPHCFSSVQGLNPLNCMFVHMIPEQNKYKERSLHNYRLGRHISETQYMESTLLLVSRHLEVLNMLNCRVT